eukprot:TRINITY_DN54726_c0_g1_i1.p1 TRINITY_DN54726_c0_g1~~TRINITY_DN54726_c0_g1_i1.p1  ORF type:complete len:268 (+),score=49.67 TRINITY_DN54726_c0_g1_i1:98-901(+)
MGSGASAEQKEGVRQATAAVRSVISAVSVEDLKAGAEDLFKDLPEEKKKALAEAFKAAGAVPAEEKKEEAVPAEEKKEEAASAEERKEDPLAAIDQALKEAHTYIEAADQALDGFTKKDFPVDAIRSQVNMPDNLLSTVLDVYIHLQAGVYEINVDKRRTPEGKYQLLTLLNHPEKFMSQLKGFKSRIDDGDVPQQNIDAARKIIDAQGANFSPEVVKKQTWKLATKLPLTSNGAACLCDWILNIMNYYDRVAAVNALKPKLAAAKT